jgi:hypothetical protein
MGINFTGSSAKWFNLGTELFKSHFELNHSLIGKRIALQEKIGENTAGCAGWDA